MCFLLYVECLSRMGLEQGAVLLREDPRYANHLGLYGEQLGQRGEHLGNFPQAFTHLALISAAYDLDRRLSAAAGAREAAASTIDDPPPRRPTMSGLRIIGGRSRAAAARPTRPRDRPLPDRVKQALFDWLGQRLDGLLVVDCCAARGVHVRGPQPGRPTGGGDRAGPHAVPVLQANAAKLGNPPNVVLHARPFRAVLPAPWRRSFSSPTLPSPGTRTTPRSSPSCCARRALPRARRPPS